jgi:hypothetical protein
MKDYKFDLECEGKKYSLVFNLNVMEVIQEEFGTIQKWGELTDGKSGEPNLKALVFGLTEMMNEAIEIENDEKGSNKPLLSKKQVGRIISKIGLENATNQLNTAIVESTKTDEKN